MFLIYHLNLDAENHPAAEASRLCLCSKSPTERRLKEHLITRIRRTGMQVVYQHLSFETIFYEVDFFFGLQISRCNSVDSYIPANFPFKISFFNGLSFIPLFFTSGERNFDLEKIAFIIHC